MTEQVIQKQCEIKKVLEEHNSIFIDIDDELSLYKIHALICKHIVKEEPTNDLELFYFGWYYFIIEKNYILMKQYLNMAIQHGHATAMYTLGTYYHNVDKDYDKMKQYYTMAIQHGHSNAMNNLGYYYKNIEQDYDKMKQYYTMAIQHGDSIAMYNLGYYHETAEKNYDKMKKYYTMAIQHGDSDAMNNLGVYYQNIEKEYDKMKQYYTMAIQHGSTKAINNLSRYYKDEGKNDLSFVDFFDIPSLRQLLSKRLKVIKKVPKEYHSSFCKWNFNDDHDDHELKMKQYILRKTGIYPCNYDPALLLHFMELMLLSEKPVALPKDIILTIAGYLFV